MKKYLIICGLLFATSTFAEKVEISTEGKFCRTGYGNYFDSNNETMLGHSLSRQVDISKICFEGKEYIIIGQGSIALMSITGESCSCKKEVPLESGKEKIKQPD